MLNRLMHVQDYFISYLERFSTSKNWKARFSGLCFVIVLFFSFPPYESLLQPQRKGDTWDVVLKQIEHPLVPQQVNDQNSHQAKRSFRLFVPVASKMLFVKSKFIIYFIQLIVSILFFYLVIGLSEKITGNKVIAMLMSLGFCFVYAGQAGILDVFAKFDGIAITCLLAALYFTNPIAIFLFCSASAWTDERGLLAATFVFIWWQIRGNGIRNFRSLLIPTQNGGAVLIAMLAYLLTRYYLQNQFGLQTPVGNIGLPLFFSQLNMLFFGLWSGFEGFWVIILIAVGSLLIKRQYQLTLLILLACSISFMVSFLVIDITRSLIYCVPLVFISLDVLSKENDNNNLQKLVFFSFLLSFLVPTYFAEGGFRIEGSNPLLLKLADLFRSGIN